MTEEPIQTRRRRVSRHVRSNKKKYSIGTIAFFFVIVQMIWDISANDLAAYVQPIFTMLLGEPPK